MKNKKVNTMSKRDVNDNKVIVIVGGGPAALACAENLRQMEFVRLVFYAKGNLKLFYQSGIELESGEERISFLT